jgi:hypothetical protein
LTPNLVRREKKFMMGEALMADQGRLPCRPVRGEPARRALRVFKRIAA